MDNNRSDKLVFKLKIKLQNTLKRQQFQALSQDLVTFRQSEDKQKAFQTAVVSWKGKPMTSEYGPIYIWRLMKYKVIYKHLKKNLFGLG